MSENEGLILRFIDEILRKADFSAVDQYVSGSRTERSRKNGRAVTG